MLQRKYRTPESTWMGCSSEVGQMETTDWEALEGPQRVSLCWNEHGSWGGERKEGWREQGRGWLLKDQTAILRSQDFILRAWEPLLGSKQSLMWMNLHFTNITVAAVRTVDCSKCEWVCEYGETDSEAVTFFSVSLSLMSKNSVS